MTLDINVGKVRNNCFRQSKIPGEFLLQLRSPGGLVDAKWLEMIQMLCQEYGDGNFHFGTRQTFNITGIKYEDIPKINEIIRPYIEEIEGSRGVDIEYNDEGYPYIGPRNIMACIGGRHCIKAAQNTQRLADKLEPIIYGSPYQIKTAIAGCPNDCVKAHFTDFGFIGVTIPEYDIDRCIGCGACVDRCKAVATRVLELNDQGKVDKDLCCCVGCGECVTRCPNSAWRRPNRRMWNVIIGGRTGKQNPRMGQMFARWMDEDVVIKMMKNWKEFSAYVLDNKPVYLHGGHLIDRVGFPTFKKMMLKDVELNEECLIADRINWTEKEYRSSINVMKLEDHKTVK
ncbi:sulfite reductase subunit C [Anaerococcus sp. AGMB00486]|uniref:Sulfite reductase subunit C n=2 Tax=Anaerococcus TaxID=165779 RepID=A0ABX2NCW5_9FIRM|nr:MULTISPECIES: sulfite reductase subunit C [Anaerococcus]MSS78610.1 sulfite reductase subunit C [Anaerococcus porci]NVF12478.1 sulfite reductase subunit C [Anaerococcus faecalis]